MKIDVTAKEIRVIEEDGRTYLEVNGDETEPRQSVTTIWTDGEPPVYAPVRHGDWRFVSTDEMKKRRGEFSFLWASDTWMNYECTVCGYMIHNTLHNGADNRSRYCPNCGARMDEVSE